MVCFFFLLWAIISFHKSKAWLKSGLLLGCALNIKLLPVFLIPVFIAIAGDYRSIRLFITGLVISSSPWLAFFLFDPYALFNKVINYIPELKFRWGMPVILQGTLLQHWYYVNGKYISISGVVLVSIGYRIREKNDPFLLIILSSLIFIVLAPAIFMYYLMYTHLFILFRSPRLFIATEFLLAPLLFFFSEPAMGLNGILSENDVLVLSSIIVPTLYTIWIFYTVRLLKSLFMQSLPDVSDSQLSPQVRWENNQGSHSTPE